MGSTLEYQTQEQAPTNLNTLFPHVWNAAGEVWVLRETLGGERLFSEFPKSALMTRESVMEDEKLCDAVNRHSSLSPAQTSRWHPYLVHMPQTYDILAMFGEFEKRALQVDEAMWVTEKAMLKAKSEWKEAHALMEDLMFKPQFLTFKAWVWAAATTTLILTQRLTDGWFEEDVNAYCFYSRAHYKKGDQTTLILTQRLTDGWFEEDVNAYCFYSRAHYKKGDQTTLILTQRLTDGWFEEDVNAYCFYSRAHYKKGDQVLLCYGIYTNLELVEHYGFLLQENPNDKVFIPLEPAVYSSTSWSKESLYVHHNGKPSYALLAALRLWATPQNKRRSVGHLVHSGSQLSADNEIFIMKWLSKTCDAVLKNLPTSIEEDTLLLNAMDNSQDFSTFIEITKLMSSRDEIHTCLEAHKMKDAHSFNDVILCRKARRSMDKWKLAVQWRLKYKEVYSQSDSLNTPSSSKKKRKQMP
ncbi:hypothetical protein JHK86_005252 [Glycine max]|nr:hypothetical protein JHK86_005252 [Glycine max]